MVDRRWAIDWEAALAPPLAMIPDLSIFVSPKFDPPVGADVSRPGAMNCAATAVGVDVSRPSGPPEWESALLVGSENVEAGGAEPPPLLNGGLGNGQACEESVAGGAEPPPLLGRVEEEEAAAFQRDSLHL